MKTILLILFLILPAAAQGPIQPVRVSIVVKGDNAAALNDAMLEELRKNRVIIGSKKNADFVLQLAGERFDGPCNGVVVALLSSGPSGHEIQALAGSDWQEVAALIARQIAIEARAFGLERRK